MMYLLIIASAFIGSASGILFAGWLFQRGDHKRKADDYDRRVRTYAFHAAAFAATDAAQDAILDSCGVAERDLRSVERRRAQRNSAMMEALDL